jgi:hypothetical protein
MAKQPVVKFRVGFVTATVWLNDRFYSTVLSKSYKDGDEYRLRNATATGDDDQNGNRPRDAELDLG